MTDRELEQILYRGPQRIQDVMDAEIAKRHEFTEALITFEDGETRTLRVPTGVTPEMVKQQVETQFAENIYGGRLTAEWLNYTDPELQQRLEAARPEYERLTASSDPEERGKADPALGVQLSLLNQVKGLVKKGNIKVNNQVFYEGFIPYNIDMRGVQTQLLYIVEQAPTISYWTATFSNYLDVLTQDDFFLWIWNSLLITVSTAFLGVALSSTGAYAFSRFEFPGRKAGLIFLLTTQMIPAGMLMLPIWIIAFNLGLIGQWSGLVLAYSVGSIPFSIWILKGYYDTIPKELEEAATIDGATKMQTFFLIMLPLAAPALAIVFLFNFMNAWNDYLLAKIMIENRDKYTWPLGLERMQGQFNTKWGAFAAAAIMVSVPVVILFLSSSKYLVSGLTLGSVKG
jgi:arabinogalactan oligomer/maltooligosaccharide transport system permease protein